ncbi:MAG: hypothetical protein ACI3XR_08585 [Eubacteriales bacterium]
MASIFQLFGSIFIDNSAANQSIDTTTSKAESAGSKIGSAFSTIAKGAAAVGTATVAAAGALGTAAYKMATSTASNADEIDKLSERTAINREELQRWMYACDQSGVSSSTLETAIKKMSTAVEEYRSWTEAGSEGTNTYAEAIGKLGLAYEDLDGLSTEEKFEKIAEALADMEDGTERNDVGATLLGKSYTELLPLLNAGADGIAALKNEADELGLVMSEDAVKSGVKLGDTISSIQKACTGMANALGSAVVPLVQSVADKIVAGIPAANNLLQQVIPTAVSAFEQIIVPLSGMASDIIPTIISLISTLLPIVSDLVGSVLPVILDGLRGAAPFLSDLVKRFLPVLVNLIGRLMPILGEVAGSILPVFADLFEQIFPFLVDLIDLLLPAFADLSESLLPVLVQVVDGILPVILELLTGILPLILQVVQSVLPVLLQLITELMPTILQIVQSVLPVILSLVQTLLPLITTVVEAVLPVLVTLLEAILPLLSPILDLIHAILAPLLELLNGILRPIVDILSRIINAVMPVLQSAMKELSKLLTDQLVGACESVWKIFGNLKSIFESVIDFIKNVFTGDWKGAWQNIKDIFAGIWDNFLIIAKTPINWIIDAINTLIRGVNKVSFDVPDWVPGIGGQKFGFNLAEIPKLRRGLEYVPYDDYPALLHRGEKVLTASEAEKDRKEAVSDRNNPDRTINVNVSVNIENFENRTESDLDDLITEVMDRIEDEIRKRKEAFA